MDFIRFVVLWLLESSVTASFNLNRHKPCAVSLITWTSSQIHLTWVWSDSVFWKVSQQFVWKTFHFHAYMMDLKKWHRASQTPPTLFYIRVLLPACSQICAQTSQPSLIGQLLPRYSTCRRAIGPFPTQWRTCQWYQEISSHSPFSTLNVLPRQWQYLQRLPGNPKMELLTTG